MIKDVGRDLASGLVAAGGTAAAVAGIEASLPVIASIGAFAALGAGIYQVASGMQQKKLQRAALLGPQKKHSRIRGQKKALAGKI